MFTTVYRKCRWHNVHARPIYSLCSRNASFMYWTIGLLNSSHQGCHATETDNDWPVSPTALFSGRGSGCQEVLYEKIFPPQVFDMTYQIRERESRPTGAVFLMPTLFWQPCLHLPPSHNPSTRNSIMGQSAYINIHHAAAPDHQNDAFCAAQISSISLRFLNLSKHCFVWGMSSAILFKL